MKDVEQGAVAVIIVNYGTAELTIQAAKSVLTRNHGDRRVEVHIVDNASPGDDVGVLEKAHAAQGWAEQGVFFYPEPENHGFGRGNNVVLYRLSERDAPPEFVFLLNSDAWLENETLDILACALEAESRAAGAGAGIFDEDGHPAVSAFRFPTMLSEVIIYAGVGALGRLFKTARVPLPPDHDGPVDWVAGASVMFRFEVLKKVRFFDPVYFLYYEEVDMMRRMRAAGHRMLYVRDAAVTHIAGVSTEVKTGHRENARRPRYIYESWRFYFHRQHGWAYALTTALLVAGASMINRAVAAVKRKSAGLPAHFLADHTRFVVMPLLREIGKTREKEYDRRRNL